MTDDEHLNEARAKFVKLLESPQLKAAAIEDFCKALNKAANLPTRKNIQVCAESTGGPSSPVSTAYLCLTLAMQRFHHKAHVQSR